MFDDDDVARVLALQRKQVDAIERLCGYLLRLAEGVEALVVLGQQQLEAWHAASDIEPLDEEER